MIPVPRGLRTRAGVLRLFSQQSEKRIVIYNSEINNPFQNIAFEQYLLNNRPADDKCSIMYLWRNEPSIIIGRFQSAWKECKVEKMAEDGVHLVRRASGGGAVYQDLGNSIFSFIAPKETYKVKENNGIITNALRRFNVEAEATGRNDIVVNGLKISGAAFRHAKHHSLHHGTLLLDVDMTALGNYLTPHRLKLMSKGIASVAARVMNLKQIVPSITHEQVCDALVTSYFEHHGEQCEVINVTSAYLEQHTPDVASIAQELQQWEWRFGNEPTFTHHLEHRFDWGLIDIYLNVHGGVIEDITVYSDALDVNMITAIQESIVRIKYSRQDISDACSTLLQVYGGVVNEAHAKEFAAWLLSEI